MECCCDWFEEAGRLRAVIIENEEELQRLRATMAAAGAALMSITTPPVTSAAIASAEIARTHPLTLLN